MRSIQKALCPFVVLLCCAPVLAQNVVVNPNFDNDLADWNVLSAIDAVWDPEDYAGDSN